jgi:hypothetical protein
MYSSLCNPSLIGRINLVVECQDEILSKGVGCDDLTFHLRIMDAKDLTFMLSDILNLKHKWVKNLD